MVMLTTSLDPDDELKSKKLPALRSLNISHSLRKCWQILNTYFTEANNHENPAKKIF